MLRNSWLALSAALVMSGAAARAETLRVGNDAPTSIPYCSLDIGIERGIFARRGLEIEAATFFGASKGQPALIGGVVDMETGAGSEMAYIAKGAPEIAVAVFVGPPADMTMTVGANSPVTKLSQLKGGKIGISNPGGLTDWLAHQVIKREGFAANEITVVSAGNAQTEVALLRTGGLDGAVLDAVSAFSAEEAGGARVVRTFGDYVPDFAQGVIFARSELVAAHPETVRAFVAAMFEARDAMLADKDAAVACIIRKIGGSPAIAARVFEVVKTELSPDGKFTPKAMEVLAQSFVDTGVLPEKPDMTKLYTEAFLPKK